MVYVTHSGGVSFSVSGKSSAADLTTQVKVGENFIGPAVQSSTAVTTVLSGLTYGTHYSDVKRWNAGTQAFELYSASAFTNFEPGKGYVLVGSQNTSFSYGKTETATTFVYDSAGSRVKKTSGSSTTIYLGKDYDITGSLTTKYIFLGDRRVALKDSSGTLLFLHDDHIGSSNAATNGSGDQAALYEYDPYGSTVTHTGSASLKHPFTGQEEDSSTKLYYYGARYYDPQLGRFVSADWIVQDPDDPQSFNRYAYARNNPILYIDPTGNAQQVKDGVRFSSAPSSDPFFSETIRGFRPQLSLPSSVQRDSLLQQAYSSLSQIQSNNSVRISASVDRFYDRNFGINLLGPGSQNPYPNHTDQGFEAAPTPGAKSVPGGGMRGPVNPGNSLFNEKERGKTKVGSQRGLKAPKKQQNIDPDGLTYRPDDTPLSGGKHGEKTQNLTGPPNSAVPGQNTRGGKKRVFVTNEIGEVVREITPDRAKPIYPRAGQGEKIVNLTDADREILKRMSDKSV